MTTTASPHRQLEAMRPTLVRFAMLQLRNASLAEDVVQDTLIAILEKPEHFAGQSTLRTYVIGIMKHKIVDALCASACECPIVAADSQSRDDVVDALFKPDGHTYEMPRQWGDPDATLEQKNFFRIMEICLEKLPATTARVFMMREWLGLETDEICKALGCSTSNAWVMLYRARIRLRECLDLHWFGHRPSGKI